MSVLMSLSRSPGSLLHWQPLASDGGIATGVSKSPATAVTLEPIIGNDKELGGRWMSRK